MNKKFWNFKASDESSAELFLYGEISNYSWWGDEVTPKQFRADLEALGEIKDLKIYVNSGGGDVFAGQTIHSMLKRHSAYKTVYIDGLAASIASVVAMAGDKIIMPSNAMMMIHDAWTYAAGSASKFRKLADDMDKIDESIVSTYVNKTGKDIDEIKNLMHAETWMSAQDAFDMGFADEIEDEKKVAASIDGEFLMFNGQKFELDRYQHKPDVAEHKPDDSRDASRPVSDTQRTKFQNIRKKILSAYEEGN